MDLRQIAQAAWEAHQGGRLGEAEAGYREVLAAAPGNPVVWHWLALVLMARGARGEAIECWREAVGRNGAFVEALSNLGAALGLEGKHEEAEGFCRRAIAVNPGYAHAYGNLGSVMQRAGKPEEAKKYYEEALAIAPGLVDTLVNLGAILNEEGEAAQAVELYRRAIGLRPEFARAHFYLALALLSLGEYEEGWREYEWRWKTEEFPSPKVWFPVERWEGQDLRGKRLLIHTEQGHGDAIQFVRYVPMLAESGVRVVLACTRELARLMGRVRGVEQVVTEGEPVADCDFYCPLMDLPRLVGTRVETIPREVPYVGVERSWGDPWKERVAAGAGRLRIGVAWRGRTQRFMGAEAWAELGRQEGVWLCSLQKDATEEETRSIGMANWGREFTDFAAVAGLIEQLDLVITVDTAIGHLAGAMGKRVWILLRPPVDWRWMRGREDTPWYPTARLFRATTREGWRGALERIVAEVRGMAGK